MRSTLTSIEHALAEAGGVQAARDRAGQLRTLLARELEHGARELAQTRSGYEQPVVIGAAAAPQGLVAVAPVAPELRADPEAVDERAWLLAAAIVGAMAEATAGGMLVAGTFDGHLALHLAASDADPELFALAFEDHAAPIDRLRAGALALPSAVLEDVHDLRRPIGAAHPLLVALEVARLGGRPADAHDVAEHEEAVLAVLEATSARANSDVVRPHDDPQPSRRVARRILQRLDGMGKWGGYHTDFTHLARGFAGNERALADEVGEALLAAGLLAEKPSVGQRHVFLNPRRAGDIRAMIERGDVPTDLVLP